MLGIVGLEVTGNEPTVLELLLVEAWSECFLPKHLEVLAYRDSQYQSGLLDGTQQSLN